MICKAAIKFPSKFQFQIVLQSEKMTKIKFVMVMVKKFDKYHHLCNLHIFTFFIAEIQVYLNIKVLNQ